VIDEDIYKNTKSDTSDTKRRHFSDFPGLFKTSVYIANPFSQLCDSFLLSTSKLSHILKNFMNPGCFPLYWYHVCVYLSLRIWFQLQLSKLYYTKHQALKILKNKILSLFSGSPCLLFLMPSAPHLLFPCFHSVLTHCVFLVPLIAKKRSAFKSNGIWNYFKLHDVSFLCLLKVRFVGWEDKTICLYSLSLLFPRYNFSKPNTFKCINE
jgi:hypothetical protein